MAPSNNSAKPLQTNRPRPAVPKPIIPAIPLPYMQKRKQQAAVPKKAKEEAEATLAETQSSSSTPATEGSPAIVNGSSDNLISISAKVVEETAPASPANSTTPAIDKEPSEKIVEESEVTAQDQTEGKARESPLSATSEAQSSASRSTYQMPPPFYPANHSQPNPITADLVKSTSQPSFNGQHPMHHAHPSTGSLVFGGYPESNNSSPAPPLSAGSVPPYQHQQHQGHAQYGGGRVHGPHYSNGGHHQNMSNGYSPMAPPGPPGYYPRPDGFMNQGSGTDGYSRRQMISFASPDGYSPSGTPLGLENQLFPTYDPSTPHSFHGSQSSAPNEQEVTGPPFYNQFPTAVISNGSNGHIDEVRLYQQPRLKGRTDSQPLVPAHGNYTQPSMGQPPLPLAMDNLDGLVAYLQTQFADHTFADYTLELRYSDDRAPPVRIPGHNLMFARSPTLKSLMTAQARESNSDGLTVRTLLIESDDRFLRSDAFWMAVQRLYGGALLHLGALAAMNSSPTAQPGSPMPGTPTDRFDLALGYAAAGHILHIPPVINRGIEIASHFVNWVTLEKALDFALGGGLDSQWTLEADNEVASPSTYGPAVNMLIHNALNFIITTFPPNFDLDASVGDPAHNRRLPVSMDERPSVPNSRLSFIKFGDHPSEESVRSTSASSTTVTLSRILLNLPFQLLKYVLESSRLGNVSGWATAALRTKVMHTVIDEREKRRTKVQFSTISNAERATNGKQWEAVGWQESLAPPYGTAETPSLMRTWVDYIVPGN